MGAQLFYPVSGVLAQGSMTATRLANAKLRLWQAPFVPTFSTTLAELNAVEATFDGYPAGGVTVSSWSNPILAPGQGSMISNGLVNFAFDGGGSGVMNLVGGFYLHTSDNVLWLVGQFPQPIPLQIAGQGFPLSLSLLFGAG